MPLDPVANRRSTLNPTSVPVQSVRAEGFIKNVNTLDDFKNTSKDVLVQTAARQVELAYPPRNGETKLT